MFYINEAEFFDTSAAQLKLVFPLKATKHEYITGFSQAILKRLNAAASKLDSAHAQIPSLQLRNYDRSYRRWLREHAQFDVTLEPVDPLASPEERKLAADFAKFWRRAERECEGWSKDFFEDADTEPYLIRWLALALSSPRIRFSPLAIPAAPTPTPRRPRPPRIAEVSDDDEWRRGAK